MKKATATAVLLSLLVAGIILYPRAVVSAPEPEVVATSTRVALAKQWCIAHIHSDAIALCEPSAYND
jgi:predicted cobalt transporter CbtA